MPFYVFVLHLYGQLLLFFVKIASFACVSELDHGEGFFAGNYTGDAEAGFVPPENSFIATEPEASILLGTVRK